jgi:hypothetical protein
LLLELKVYGVINEDLICQAWLMQVALGNAVAKVKYPRNSYWHWPLPPV